MSPRKDSTRILVISISLVVIVGIFAVILGQREGAGSLTIKTGKSELVMDFSDNKLNFSELIVSAN